MQNIKRCLATLQRLGKHHFMGWRHVFRIVLGSRLAWFGVPIITVLIGPALNFPQSTDCLWLTQADALTIGYAAKLQCSWGARSQSATTEAVNAVHDAYRW